MLKHLDLHWLVAVVVLAAFAHGQEERQRDKPRGSMFYVAVHGDDSWSGKLATANAENTDGPFATLERARDAIRELKKKRELPRGGVTVWLRGGVYERGETFELVKEDSGTESAPIVYRAYGSERVRLSGGKRIDPSHFKPVDDPAVLARLGVEARDKVLQVNLRALGISDLGEIKPWGYGWAVRPTALEFFFNNRPMTLARWPNQDWVYVEDVIGEETTVVRGKTFHKVGDFTYNGDRPKRWAGEEDIMVYGFWGRPWSAYAHKIDSLDTTNRIIRTARPYDPHGYRPRRPYYAFNILPELDAPGEWYLDRTAGILYFWPPSPVAKGEAAVSLIADLVRLRDTSYVTLRGLILETARGTAVDIKGGTHSRVAGCTIRNVGMYAVKIDGGAENGVIGCDISDTGFTAIIMIGGDRKTLAPGNHYAENNHIHDIARTGKTHGHAVTMRGCGQRVSHNLIYNTPHNPITFTWQNNDNIIEFNEICHICYHASDVGGTYSGGIWSNCGNIIRYNYFHDIMPDRHGVRGIYIDDFGSGTRVYGNLFHKVQDAVFISGGRDNTIENNIFVECRRTIYADARGLTWGAPSIEGRIKKLKQLPYGKPPWSTRYPRLVGILEDEPAKPKGNVIRRNIVVSEEKNWYSFHELARPHIVVENNFVNQDPHFIAPEKGDFRLKEDSPAFKAIGFKPIPIAKMGLYESPLRASWPVVRVPPVPDQYPRSKPKPRPLGKRPTFQVRRCGNPVTVDGNLQNAEWHDAAEVLLQSTPHGQKAGPVSQVLATWDDTALHIAFRNQVSHLKPLKSEARWGANDAVEIALRCVSTKAEAPILVLRGYPNGRFESSTEAKASAEAAGKLARATSYAARVVSPGEWTAEWRIPLAALGLDPVKQGEFDCNFTVRKTASNLWLMWHGTNGSSWEVGRAGRLKLVPARPATNTVE